MEHRIRRLSVLFVALFTSLALASGYWQIWRARSLSLDPRNPRLLIAEQQIERGAILDRRLRPLARTITQNGEFTRRYTDGPLFAHLVGYRSVSLGKVGLERALDSHLLGFERRDSWDDLRDRLTRHPLRGTDAVLTVDAELQKVAWEALGDRPGAIVVLDPRDGAVLAMASRPSFDPGAVEEQWEALRQAQGSPLLNRALQGVYTPGSAFKVITMAAALHRRAVTPETIFQDAGVIVVRGTRITNFESRACGAVTFFDALVRSCNVVFIEAGLRTGGAMLLEFARKFGIGRAPSFDLPTAAGHLPPEEEVGDAGVGQMAFGQGSLTVTPLQMALVAATFAQAGTAPRAQIVREIRTYSGKILERHRPAPRETVLDPEIARIVGRAMIQVVRRGTGRAAALPGVTVAGKTGTATVPGGMSHAWFIGFAPADAPRVAIAVVLEHGGIGGRDAAPVARRVLAKALHLE